MGAIKSAHCKVLGPDNEPLIGANIIVVGTILGTTTNIDGDFSFTVKQDFPIVIRISMIGYEGQEIEVTTENAANLDISLSEQAIMGQEVVVSASRVEERSWNHPFLLRKWVF